MDERNRIFRGNNLLQTRGIKNRSLDRSSTFNSVKNCSNYSNLLLALSLTHFSSVISVTDYGRVGDRTTEFYVENVPLVVNIDRSTAFTVSEFGSVRTQTLSPA